MGERLGSLDRRNLFYSREPSSVRCFRRLYLEIQDGFQSCGDPIDLLLLLFLPYLRRYILISYVKEALY